jgi:hypothetical protein
VTTGLDPRQPFKVAVHKPLVCVSGHVMATLLGPLTISLFPPPNDHGEGITSAFVGGASAAGDGTAKVALSTEGDGKHSGAICRAPRIGKSVLEVLASPPR